MILSFNPHHCLTEAMLSYWETSVYITINHATSPHSQLTNSHYSCNLSEGSFNMSNSILHLRIEYNHDCFKLSNVSGNIINLSASQPHFFLALHYSVCPSIVSLLTCRSLSVQACVFMCWSTRDRQLQEAGHMREWLIGGSVGQCVWRRRRGKQSDSRAFAGKTYEVVKIKIS